MRHNHLPRGLWHSHRISIIVIGLMTVLTLGLLYIFGFLSGGATDTDSPETVAKRYIFYDFDLQLSIDLAVEQKEGRLWFDLHGIQYNNLSASWAPEEQNQMSQLLDQTQLRWQAVRTPSRTCDGHTFEYYAALTTVHSGDFPSPSMRSLGGINNFIDLESEDHGYFYCLRVKGKNYYLYIPTDRPVYTLPPKLSRIQQKGDYLSFSIDDVTAGYPLDWRIWYGWVSDQILEDYQADEASGIDYNGCNRRLFEEMRFNFAAPYTRRVVEIPVRKQDIGRRLCIRITNQSVPHLLAYSLSHKINNLTDFIPEPTLFEEDLPEQFGLEEAMQILKKQLTPAGLAAMEGVHFKVEVIDIQAAGSTLKRSYLSVIVSGGAAIEVILDPINFPTNYADLSADHKLHAIQLAVNVLAHEYVHVLGWRNGFHSVYTHRCPLSVGFNFSNELMYDTLSARKYQVFWSRYSQCLTTHATLGLVYAQLNQHAINYRKAIQDNGAAFTTTYPFPVIEDNWGFYPGSRFWYAELYAEAPLHGIKLPPALEDHYNQFFQDYYTFSRNLREGRDLWD